MALPSNITSMTRWFLALMLVCVIPVSSYSMEDKLQRFTLPSGLEVLVKEDHARKVAAIQYWVMVGSADEEASERGISHLIEHMAFKGTERRGVGQIAAEIEALGGEINAYTSWDETVFHVTVPSRVTVQGLDILTDAVFRPVIDPKELALEKQVVIEEILEGEERPERKSSRLIFGTAYSDSPYKYPVIGYKDIVEKFTQNDILSFRKKWYVPENMFLLIVGDVNAESLRKELERMTADLKPIGLFRTPRPVEPVQKEIRSALERDRNSRETRLNIAFHIPSVKGNDVNALDLTGDLLGSRDNSRLVRVLKKEKGLVNSIAAFAYTPKDPGLMLVSATLDSKNLETVTKAIMDELNQLGKQSPSTEELERAKVHIESQHIYARETVQGTARSIGNFKADIGDPAYEEKYLKLNAAVTPDQISTVIERYLTPPNVSVSVLLPEQELPDFKIERLTKIIESFRPGSVASSTEINSQKTITSTLSNGIRVALLPDDSNPDVSVRMAFLGGKRYETKENEGIMNFIAQMLTKGTAKMSEADIAAKVDDMGGRLSGFSGYDSFGFSATFFSRNFKQGLALLADLYTGASFPEDRVERERALILNRIKTEPDRPVPYTINILSSTVFPEHPYGFDKEGALATVAGFTVEDLKQTYARFATPSNMVLTIVGDIDAKKAMNQVEETFGKVSAGKLDAPVIVKEKPLKGVREKVVRIPRAKAHLALGFIGSTLSDPDRYSLDVLNNILAGQGGRLFMQLRDKESLAYTVTSFVRPGMDPGIFAFYIACDAPKADRALQGLLEQINLIREKPVTDKELNRSISNLVGEYLINLQSSWSRAENTALNTLYGLGYDYDKEYVKKISAVTAQDVLKAAGKYLDTKNYALVKILPDEKEK